MGTEPAFSKWGSDRHRDQLCDDWGYPNRPEVLGGQTGVHNEQTVFISVTNYLPGVHNEQTVCETVPRGLQAAVVAAYVSIAKAAQKVATQCQRHKLHYNQWMRVKEWSDWTKQKNEEGDDIISSNMHKLWEETGNIFHHNTGHSGRPQILLAENVQ